MRSFTRAAAEHRISQSAASQHIQEVERRLGVALVDRATRPMNLTPAGKLYAGFCRDVLRREDQFLVALETVKAKVEGEVRVASIYSIGLSEMSHLRERFACRYPDATLAVEYLRPDKVYEAVLEDRADLGFVSYPSSSKDLAVIDWRHEEMAVAVPVSHPLAAKQLLRPEDLDGVEFVAFDPDLAIRRELDRFFRERGVEVHITMHFDNIQMVKEAVAVGSGISVLPARTMQEEIERGRLISVPLHAPGLYRPVGIIHRRKKALNRAAQSLLELLEEQPSTPEHACSIMASERHETD